VDLEGDSLAKVADGEEKCEGPRRVGDGRDRRTGPSRNTTTGVPASAEVPAPAKSGVNSGALEWVDYGPTRASHRRGRRISQSFRTSLSRNVAHLVSADL